MCSLFHFMYQSCYSVTNHKFNCFFLSALKEVTEVNKDVLRMEAVTVSDISIMRSLNYNLQSSGFSTYVDE